MQSKNALSNLKNRYVAVLKKCALLNVFGTLAVATMLASPFMASEALASSMQASASNPVLNNNGTLTGDMFQILGKGKIDIAMLGMHTTGSLNYIFTNYGDIKINTTSAISATDAGASSMGMTAFGNGNHVLTNNGTINITSTAGIASSNTQEVDSSANIVALVTGGNGSHRLTNTDTINITAIGGTATSVNAGAEAYTDAYGMNANGDGSHTLSNSGSINIIAKGGKATSTDALADAEANAYGMSASGDNSHTLTNSGTINITAIGGAATSTNSDVYAKAEAYGMSASDDGSHTLTNSKTINITAIGGTATTNIGANANANAQTYGMSASDDGTHTLTNSGAISLTATGGTATSTSGPANAIAEAYGMHTQDIGKSTLTNSGTINITSKGGTATSTSDRGQAYAFAYGIRAESIGDHTLTNSGTINLTAIGGTGNSAATAEAYGMSSVNNGNHTLTNSGIINVTAIGGTGTSTPSSAYAHAYGMDIATQTSASTKINNTGIINASASVQTTGAKTQAFEVYGSPNYSVGTWATTLRDWSANDNVFAVDTVLGPQITFDNSTLILRPGTAEQNFALGKEYTVANMVSISTGSSMTQQASGSLYVLGNISEAKTEVPFLKATLTNGSTASTATVKLEANINEETTPGATTMQQAVSQVQNQFTNISASLRKNLVKVYTDANLIAQNENIGMAAGSHMEQSKWQIFLTPYISKVDNSNFDYNGNNSGITGGLTYNVSESFSLGAHLDFNEGNYNADMFNMGIDSSSLAFGLHANYNIMPEWYVRSQITASISENDVDYTVNPAVSAQSDYAGKALYAELATGYTFQFGKSHFLTPELGFSYLSAHIDDYDIEWTVSGYNMHYDSSSYNALYANFNLDWRSEWTISDNKSVSLLAGAGVRQKLTSDDIESQLSLYGTNFTTKNSEDDTVFLADFGLEYKIHDFSLSLNYSGEYGSSQQVHRGYATLKYVF